MSSSANGKVIDEHDAGIPGLDVELADVSQVLVVSLGKGTTATDGSFSLTYPERLSSNEPGRQVRLLRLRILVGLHPIKEIRTGSIAVATLGRWCPRMNWPPPDMKRPIGPGLRRCGDLSVTRVVAPSKKRGFCSAFAANAVGHIHVPGVALDCPVSCFEVVRSAMKN
jgi:hypothetical protein